MFLELPSKKGVNKGNISENRQCNGQQKTFTKRPTMNYTTLHRKLKIEQDERHVKHLG